MSGDGVQNLEPHLLQIINELSENKSIWFEDVNLYLMKDKEYIQPQHNKSEFDYTF